jgi:putative lipoic acid-binding regulatory protein
VQKRPDITYPCSWSYVVVGEGEGELMAHIERALAGAVHTKTTSRRSASGKYASIEVTLVVVDEEQRLVVLRALQAHPAVRVVI